MGSKMISKTSFTFLQNKESGLKTAAAIHVHAVDITDMKVGMYYRAVIKL
jgi:hypothetical protein